MAEGRVVIADAVGLHARPAARFVKLAASFASDIVVRRNDRTANAKSILQVLTLEAGQGAEIVLQADGPDADDAVQALVQLLTGDAKGH